jgi:hypothetical protein
MATGAAQAPAIATAISFLFIRISFVEMRPCVYFCVSWETSWGFCRPDSGNFLEFFSRSQAHHAKAAGNAQGVFRQSRNKPAPLL